MIGHFAVVFGCVCGLLKLPLIKTQQLFLFSTLRTVIASAVRLGNIGPLQVTTGSTEQKSTAVFLSFLVTPIGLLSHT